MSSFLDKLKSEPALVIGALAAALLAALQSLAGSDLIGQNVLDFVVKALSPDGGWALPIIIAIVTRFFVSPAAKPGL